MPNLLDTTARRLDDFVAAFEAAWTKTVRPDLDAFLPQRDHPLFREVLRELIRVDLEFGWQRGAPASLDHYQKRYPDLFADRESLAAVTFEEYRLRRQAGQNPNPEEYARRFGSNVAAWPSDSAPADALPRTLVVEQAADADSGHASLDSSPSAAPRSEVDPNLLAALQRCDPQMAERLTQSLTRMPQAGGIFLGFRLIRELGRGAFGRVFLAQQPTLANRHVVLKIAPDIGDESQTLAQLQHTHIVPIYSVHQADPFQAVCMPYYGATTLADVLHDLASRPTLPESAQDLLSTLLVRSDKARQSRRTGGSPVPQEADGQASRLSDVAEPATAPLQAVFKELAGRSYVEAVLWLGKCLADGLAHAHERGIIHRDLKPANVLITDDGQPMLLDFNLSDNLRLRGTASAALLGGTLPYMAPEHLDAFRGGPRQVDARSDLYAVGILLFELLTGQAPFDKGKPSQTRSSRPHELVDEMIAERRHGPPALRRWNRSVTPAVEAIVHKCLEPDQERRYQTARQLQEDLQRQIDHLPLKHARERSLRERLGKWLHRHPRLVWKLTGVAAALFLIVAVTFGIRASQHARAERALLCLDGFRTDLQSVRTLLNAQIDDPVERQRGLRLGGAALARYSVLSEAKWGEHENLAALPAEERSRLERDLGDLLLLLARAQAWPVAAVPGNALDADQTLHKALVLNQRAERFYATEAAPPALWLQRANLMRRLNRPAEAERLHKQASGLSPQTAQDFFLLAREHLSAGRTAEAIPLLRRATELEPKHYWAWFLLGNCYDDGGEDVKASVCYSVCIALAPNAYEARFNRGLAALRQREFASALADFDQAVELRPDLPEPYINRSLSRQGLNQLVEAERDLTRALEKEGAPTRVYFMRARVRQKAVDKEGAERDRAEGMRRQPNEEKSWIARGFARLESEPTAALADFEEALHLNPRSRAALQNKAHVLAEKLGRTEDAIKVLDEAVGLFPDDLPARVGRGVLYARQGRRLAAHADAENVLKRNPKGVLRYQVACIYALTSKDNPADWPIALRYLIDSLRQGFGAELLARDTDLAPLRSLPEFQRLASAAAAWQAALRMLER